MAHLLVFNKEAEANAGLWQKGDIVFVAPDTHQWGRKELDPDRFLIVHTDMDLEEARGHCVPWTKSTGERWKSQWRYDIETHSLRCKKTRKKKPL